MDLGFSKNVVPERSNLIESAGFQNLSVSAAGNDPRFERCDSQLPRDVLPSGQTEQSPAQEVTHRQRTQRRVHRAKEGQRGQSRNNRRADLSGKARIGLAWNAQMRKVIEASPIYYPTAR